MAVFNVCWNTLYIYQNEKSLATQRVPQSGSLMALYDHKIIRYICVYDQVVRFAFFQKQHRYFRVPEVDTPEVLSA